MLVLLVELLCMKLVKNCNNLNIIKKTIEKFPINVYNWAGDVK